MLFIEKETGEICELCIRSVGESYNNLEVVGIYPLGEIVIIGNIKTENDSQPFQERFELLGTL